MRYWSNSLRIGPTRIGADRAVYFIADIASSHDGDLERAKALIWKAKEAGADCAKFQHFLAEHIVSDAGFRALGGQMAHQAAWKKPVYDIYAQYQTPREWTEALVAECERAGITYMTTPYDLEAIRLMQPHVPAFKIGSGDIGWTYLIEEAASLGKPVILSTGAATMEDVDRAVTAALRHTGDICLMQCNTNYTGELENFAHVNLNVLRAFAVKWPGMVLGLSDHTPGHAAVLGAVALGARVVEKHFTDDTTREGPDHAFSMDPAGWRDMVDRTRELELALGDGVKRIEANEHQSAIVQRRAIRLRRDLPAGHVLTMADVEMLRPRPEGALEPWQLREVVGRELLFDMTAGEALFESQFGQRREDFFGAAVAAE